MRGWDAAVEGKVPGDEDYHFQDCGDPGIGFAGGDGAEWFLRRRARRRLGSVRVGG